MTDTPTPVPHTKYHVFLASPGDMDEERQAVRDFFKNYNDSNARHHNYELEVIDWENCSHTGFGRAQQLITKQTLEKYKGSLVLFIGLLGQRFGTHTGDYESGTEEEFATVLKFREAQQDYPEIKWFFREDWKSSAPDDPQLLMPFIEQMTKVKDFKTRLQTAKPQFFTKDFTTTKDFQEVFRKDLNLWLHEPKHPWHSPTTRNKTEQTTKAPETPEHIKQLLQSWLNLTADECAHLPLEVLNAKQGMEHGDKIELHDIFVPLKAFAPPKQWHEAEHLSPELARALEQEKTNKPVAVMDLINKHTHAVIIGDPGSGKSVFINQLCWLLHYQPITHGLLANRIPVRIILRDIDISQQTDKTSPACLWDAIEKDISEKLKPHGEAHHAQAVLTALRQKLLSKPYGVIMLDGLDEVSVAHQRRSQLISAIKSLVTALPNCQFIVTARPYAYTEQNWRLANFSEFMLTDFDQQQRQLFIEQWYNTISSRLYLKADEVRQRVTDLTLQIENQKHLLELAKRPLLLTLIALLHASGKRLPKDRAQLYDDCIDLLLYRWKCEAYRVVDGQRMYLDDNQLNSALQLLAYNCHKTQQSLQDYELPADIPKTAILEAFTDVIKAQGEDNLLPFLHQHTGILIARKQDNFAFPHRSFQEYLAMRYLTLQKPLQLIPTVSTEPLWWREVFLLAVIKQKPENPYHASFYIKDLLEIARKQNPETQNRLYILAAQALRELEPNDHPDLTAKIRSALEHLISSPKLLNIKERAEAGRALSAIGDTREGVGVKEGLPDILWRTIPGGMVTLEKNKGKFKVKAFELAAYPITNAQFQCFIDAGAYEQECWWTGLAQRILKPKQPQWSEANHPRENVNWYEAMAFCAWLSVQLNKDIRLPTEWQWQQAATSCKPENKYPWGKTYQAGFANIRVSNDDYFLKKTSAVGLYPQGNSGQEVADLSGNVCEWCLNDHKKPDNCDISGTFGRVVRGGSWYYYVTFAHASARLNDSPDNRGYDLGFRVCCVSPIKSTVHGDTVF
jgi:formylglycine-generating enzyme required for sulfatase activity